MDYAITVELMRHAKTKSNVERKYLGWTDESIILNQDLPIIDELATVVFGSDLKRCEETAACYFPNANYINNRGFRESYFGDFECQTYEQLKDLYAYRNWIDNPYELAPPNGETLKQVMFRVTEAVKSLPKGLSHYRIVAHGGSIRAMLMQFAPEEKTFWEWQVSHEERFLLHWSTIKQFEEGQRCTFLSVEPITAKGNM
ncbi:histidine phosphatase family protein [Viridibacillus sp. YIM B01967]|uniref:Histidine phosphatase family protein n=1 Tax=Viridibacillus soli TaxID=2798301 RepID=A0ABS1H995_9BACL|nr:histidine phosphatase family protein [Viridibacillus soli]MBK3495672.1 histidine phosphatase family protein [Viridibacillus soli]